MWNRRGLVHMTRNGLPSQLVLKEVEDKSQIKNVRGAKNCVMRVSRLSSTGMQLERFPPQNFISAIEKHEYRCKQTKHRSCVNVL